MVKKTQSEKPTPKKTASRKKPAKPEAAAKPAPRRKPAAPATAPPPSFPVVGIGASAGGLEALEQFLSHVPTGSRMAFVIVQHLDPSRKGALPQLLQRVTPMPVVQADDGMAIEAGHVYIIPPNKDLAVREGVLYLSAPEVPRGLR